MIPALQPVLLFPLPIPDLQSHWPFFIFLNICYFSIWRHFWMFAPTFLQMLLTQVLVQLAPVLYEVKWSESHFVMSSSLRPHGLYSTWNSPGQNTRVDSLSLLRGIFPTQALNPALPHCSQILYQLSHKGSPILYKWSHNTVTGITSHSVLQTRNPVSSFEALFFYVTQVWFSITFLIYHLNISWLTLTLTLFFSLHCHYLAIFFLND